MATPVNLEELLYPGAESPELGDRLVEKARNSGLSPSRMLSTEELEALPDPEWYLEGFIQEDSLTIVYGPPKTGKTFLCVEWANRLALGTDWLEHRTLPTRVLYASAEGNKSLGRRTRALRSRHGLPMPKNLMWLPGITELYYKGERPQAQQELILAIAEFQPHVVFFDTLARHTPGGNIAANEDMSRVVQVADELRAGFGCSVVFVHHTRKDGGDYLGATHLYGATDTMVELKPSEHRGRFDLSVITKELEDYTPPWTFEIVSHDHSAVLEEGQRHVKGGREEEILEFVLTFGPCTAKDVQEAIYGTEGKDANNYLKSLESKGRIEVVGRDKSGGAGRPSVLYAGVE